MEITFDKLSSIRSKYRNKRIVFRGGCFDLLHEGHVDAIRISKSLGDILVVGISSDARVSWRKGKSRPVKSESTRLAAICAMKSVDYAFVMPTLQEGAVSSAQQALETLLPDVIADGDENRVLWQDMLDRIRELGIELVFDNTSKINSTTHILDRWLERTGRS